ncbi:MAG: hypothetical protein U9O85_02945 [Euryarchaeota archaeon]|nr:hypothetical protein [Euryarchaeota archaeon]
MTEMEIVKLSQLRGIDKLEGASEEVERIRKEWDEEFEKLDAQVVKFRGIDR